MRLRARNPARSSDNFARCEVDEPLEHENRLGPAGAAVGNRRRGVGQHGARAHVRRGNAVHAGHDRGALGQRHVRSRIRAGVAQVRRAQREEIALRVERELRAHRQVAALVVGKKRLAALAGPFHRAAEALRRPRDQRELRKETVACAEVAAGVVRDHAHRGVIDAENPRELALLPHHAAAARVQRVAPRRRVVLADRGARLHRHAGDALHAGLQPHHVRGAGKGRVGGGAIAHVGVDADVGVLFLPHARRARACRVGCGGDHGQWLVDDPHPFRCVARERTRLRDDHGDGLADEAHLVRGQREMRRDEDLRAVAVGEEDVRRARRERPVRDGFQTVAQRVGAGEHGEHAGERERLRGVDRDDARVRVRRAQHGGPGLAGEVDVVAEAAAAGEQARVLLARDRLADACVGVERAGHVCVAASSAAARAICARAAAARVRSSRGRGIFRARAACRPTAPRFRRAARAPP